MSGEGGMVVNADDFGLSPAVNAGILVAYRMKILASCSLMVAEPEADEAVEIARHHPGLAVGLHVALTDATPCLPPETIPALVGADGRFYPTERILRRCLLRSAAARRQMRTEIRAQFAAFARNGLVCDHVDGHRNVELDPFVAQALFTTAREYGVRSVRVPRTPLWALPDVAGATVRAAAIARQLRSRALRAFAHDRGLVCTDYSVDLKDVDDLRTFSQRFDGSETVEIYAHPTAEIGAGASLWNPDLQRLIDERTPAAPMPGCPRAHNGCPA